MKSNKKVFHLYVNREREIPATCSDGILDFQIIKPSK